MEPRDLFATEVETIARALGHIDAVERVANHFAFDLTNTDGTQHRVFLENLFRETREMPPDARAAHIAHALTPPSMDELTWEEARERLVPVLRGATFGMLLPSQLPAVVGSPHGMGLLRRRFLPFLDVFVVIDEPTRMEFVSRSRANSWSVSDDQIFETAIRRFAGIGSGGASLYDNTCGPLFIVDRNDTYESSRLLIPGWLASFRGHVEGRPIAIVPERSFAMVGGDARPEMVSRLLETASREFAASPRSLSTALYTVDDAGRVVPYFGHGENVRVGHERLAMAEYTSQQEALRGGPDDIFVASYRVVRSPEGVILSASAWTKTVPTMLPQTDRVNLVTLNDEGTAPTDLVEVAWNAIAHRLTPVANCYPPRFLTGEFPDAAELARLRATSGR